MIDSTYMAIMGQIAVYTGKPVTWDEVTAADFEFEPKLSDVTLDMPPPTTKTSGSSVLTTTDRPRATR